MENPYNFSDEEIAEAAAKARAWPSLADTERLVTDAVVRIGEAATGIAPNARFRWHRERSQGGGCPGPYAYTDGLSITTQALLSDVPIDESNWRAVLDAARAIATEAGMDQLEVLVDQAGHHDVTFFSADGNRITFGTFKAASIRGITGCRYP
ncbi:LppA family lipoprotein [Rhodococcus sp. NPDC049939]|uniref:LppA family lipoprotein n=1 Tax=Rhodococcus sp. NPDC049939 TaxID=3155511 RepID=UPI0033E6CCC1